MYCPNCKQNVEGKFCPECGAELIPDPETSRVNINLGDANAISGGVKVENTTNVQNVDNSVTIIDNTVHNVDQSVHNTDNSVKNFDQRVTNIDQSVHNTTQNIDQSVHNTTQNVSHNVTNITQVAASEEDVALAAEKATEAIAASEAKRAEADILKEQRHQQEMQEAKRNSKKRLVWVSLIILSIIGIVGFCFYYYIHTGKSAAELAAQAVYNAAQNQGNINDIEINTSSMPNDDPSVIIDPNGDIQEQLKKYYSSVSDLKGGFYVIKQDGLYGLADAKGKIIHRPQYTYISSKDSRGMMRIEQDSKIGFLNISGSVIIKPQYDKVEKERDGLIKIMKDGLYGFIDANTMQVVAECQYTHIYNRENNKYRVLINGKTGYLNADGSLADIPD